MILNIWSVQNLFQFPSRKVWTHPGSKAHYIWASLPYSWRRARAALRQRSLWHGAVQFGWGPCTCPLQACLFSARHLTDTASRWLFLPVLMWLKPDSRLGDHKAGQILALENNQKAKCREGGGLREEEVFWAAAILPKTFINAKETALPPLHLLIWCLCLLTARRLF